MRISDWSSDVCSSDLGRMHDGFQVHELMQSIKTKFASMPRALDAAEWGFRRRCEHLVDSGHTSLDIADEPVLLLFFFIPDLLTQPEFLFICSSYRLFNFSCPVVPFLLFHFLF